MAKSIKAPKAKVKKVRTPEEKAARKEKRKIKREARKEANVIKAKIVKKEVAVIEAAAAAVQITSDGLPFRLSVDNPLSLRGQLAAAEAESKIAKISKEESDLMSYRAKRYAPSAKEGILSISMS